MKNCKNCNNQFLPKRKSRLYCSAKCKDSHWRKTHPEYHKEYFKEWRNNHPDYYKEWNKQHPGYYKGHYKQYSKYYKERLKQHPEYFKEYFKKYKKNHRAKYNIYYKEFRKKNLLMVRQREKIYRLKSPEVQKRKNKKYTLKHPEKIRLSRRRSKALRKQAGKLSMQTLQQVYEDNIKQYGTLTCYLCLKPIEFRQDSLEHKIPISRGGTNEKANLAIAHIKCNQRKMNQTYLEYLIKSAAGVSPCPPGAHYLGGKNEKSRLDLDASRRTFHFR